MRIISGKFKGRTLFSPKDERVRPTSDMVKEAIFNLVQFDVRGAKVLDLFAGSGALGIEAASRGADSVVFSDVSKDSIELLEKNLQKIGYSARVLKCDYRQALDRLAGEKFDIIFVDPPYDSGYGEKALAQILDRDLLEDEGVVVFEHSRYSPLNVDGISGIAVSKRDYGKTSITLVRKAENEDINTTENDENDTIKSDENAVKNNKKIRENAVINSEKSSEKAAKSGKNDAKNSVTAYVTGTFDPITSGHIFLVESALKEFEKVVVLCLENPEKKCYFPLENRLQFLKTAVQNFENVFVEYSDGLAVDFVKANGGGVLVRGIRGEADEKYEHAMAAWNLENGGIQTKFYFPPTDKLSISSTAVKLELADGNTQNLPESVAEVIKNTFVMLQDKT